MCIRDRHVDGRKENNLIIGKAEFDLMKDGVIFMNLSRGHVVDIAALADAIKSGKIAGAAVDVFPKEPKTNNEAFESELIGLPNVILTPHIGGSTEEAQENIGYYAVSYTHLDVYKRQSMYCPLVLASESVMN